MRQIAARNVNDAWATAVHLVKMSDGGMRREESRAGAVYVYSDPVVTSYARPTERVLLDPRRDANPFFHLAEALWMLSGRDDAAWLDQFVSDYSSRFGEPETISDYGPGPRQHGAYGRRWRNWYPLSDSVWQAPDGTCDQIDVVVRLLKSDPSDRQAVLAMWDPSSDLGVPGLRDRPCNTHAYLRVRRARGLHEAQPAPHYAKKHDSTKVMDLTVCCRSNDVVWGCYGANAVHMSVLQEYLSARIGVGVGVYYQFSNNWHVYDGTLAKCDATSARESASRPYPGTLPLVDDPESFDDELRRLMPNAEPDGLRLGDCGWMRNRVFPETVVPMMIANSCRRNGDLGAAVGYAECIAAPDWRTACVEWLKRRVKT